MQFCQGPVQVVHVEIHNERLKAGRERLENQISSQLSAKWKAKVIQTLGVTNHFDHIESLNKLGFPLSLELATDFILQSLPPSFEPFIMNFNMNN